MKNNMNRRLPLRRRTPQVSSLLLVVACLLASGCNASVVEHDYGEPRNGEHEVNPASPVVAPIDFRIPGSPAIAPGSAPVIAPVAARNMAPVREPTVAGSCYSSLNVLNEDELSVTDVSVVRDYILCSDTVFRTSRFAGFGDKESLYVRENMHIHCGGIGGSSDNNCTITGGIGLLAIGGYFQFEANFEDNVRIQGVTFKDAFENAVVLSLPGRFDFVDCIFADHTRASQAPVRIEWGIPSVRRKLESSQEKAVAQYSRDLQQEPEILNVEFTDCVFKNCASAPESFLSLISISGDDVDVKFATTLFQNNDYNVDGINDLTGYGTLIENFGTGKLEFSSTCFVNNRAIGNALVVSYAAELPTVSSNFGVGNEVEFPVTGRLECEFVALVDNDDATFPNTACAEFDAQMCSVATEPPTVPTTPAPFEAPVFSPVFSPAMAPVQTPAPIFEPTIPSPAPSREPTISGSCYTSLNALDEDERRATDLDVVRNYVLCANTTFRTSIIIGGEPEDVPLTLRKNMHIYCGEIGGSSDNNCVITFGTLLTSFRGVFDTDTYQENVIVQGITFKESLQRVMILALPGSFQFIDCIFSDHRDILDEQLLIRWDGGTVDDLVRRELEHSRGRYDHPSLERTEHGGAMKLGGSSRDLQESEEGTLRVEFIDCVFKDCSGGAVLVSSRGSGIDAKFANTLFQNNDFNVPGINDEPGFEFGAIIDFYSPGEVVALELTSTCFINNRAIGNGLVVTYGEELPTVSNNFGSDNVVVNIAGIECEFVALIDVDDISFPTIACADFDADRCAIPTEPTPPSSPETPAPVVEPTPAPVVEPTDLTPTLASSEDMPSIAAGSRDAPSFVSGPDAAPVETPVFEPSEEPVQGPTLPPLEPPSLYTPALTPNMITPNMIAPFMMAPNFFNPAMKPAVEISAPTTPVPSFVFPIFLDCRNDDSSLESDILKCHAQFCPPCNFVPLPDSTTTCENVNEWFCVLNCCADCAVLYEEAIECAEELVGVSDCRRDCDIEYDYSSKRDYNLNVAIEPFVVKFIGDFELTEEVIVLIIKTVDELIAPYLMGEVGEVLHDIDIEMKFMEEESVNITNAGSERDLESTTTALIGISGQLELKGSDEEALLEWSSERVTDVIKGFFVGGNLEKLFATLDGKDLVLDKIEMHDEDLDSIVTDEGATTQSTSDGGGDGGGGSTKNMTAIIAATVCGGIAFILLVAALYVSKHRRRKRHRSMREMQSVTDSDTFNLRSSGKDELLPDCNASTASHISFPDVFGDEEVEFSLHSSDDLPKVNESAWHASLEQPPRDEFDDELDDLLGDDFSLQAVKHGTPKTRRSHHHKHRDEHDLEKAREWAKKTRKKKRHVAPLSTPQPGDEQDML